MPIIRHSKLYQQTNDQQPAEIELPSNIYTAAQAKMKYEARMLWRKGYQYSGGTPDSITMQRDDDTVKLYIVADEPQPRARGGGRKTIAAEAMVKVNVTLHPEQVKEFERIGDGNLSAGIRRFYDMHSDT